MSKDYNIILKNAESIKGSDFDYYAYSLGYQVRISPLDTYVTQFGFLQFNIRPNFIDKMLPYDSLLSGFEVYFSKYKREDYSDEINGITAGATHDLMISVDGQDSFQELLVFLLAGYLCRSFGGVLYDPQEDKIYSRLSDIEAMCEAEKALLIDLSLKNRLMIHKFRGWG